MVISFDVLPPCAAQTGGQANTPPVVMVRSSIDERAKIQSVLRLLSHQSIMVLW